jgi:hypothetical protein
MPPGYNTRLAEIQRLSEDLRAMGRFGRLLWTVGDELADVVREVFVALKFDAEPTPGQGPSSVTVHLDVRRRLLLYVSAAHTTVQKKDPELAGVFQMVHELAEETDRVVLIANCEPSIRPADRQETIEPEAEKLLRRLGANVTTAPALFALWMLSLSDRDRARTWIDRLHAQDGGMFELPSVGTL